MTLLNPPEGLVGGWPVLYNSFTGTLPIITEVNLTVLKPEIDIEEQFSCLAANMTWQMSWSFERGGELNLRTSTNSTSSDPVTNLRSGGGFGCPSTSGEFRMTGVGAVTYAGTTTAIGIRLI